MTRRSFLAAIACLPVVGKWVPQPEPQAIDMKWHSYGAGDITGKVVITSGDKAYVFDDDATIKKLIKARDDVFLQAFKDAHKL